MKFQDPCIHGSKVTGGIRKCDERTNERWTDGRTDADAKSHMPTNVFKVGGITTTYPTPLDVGSVKCPLFSRPRGF